MSDRAEVRVEATRDLGDDVKQGDAGRIVEKTGDDLRVAFDSGSELGALREHVDVTDIV